MRRWLGAICAGVALLASACNGDRSFTIAGYSTCPNYDTRYKTVHVPIFKNLTFRQGLEFDLTKEVIDQINTTTPMRVVPLDQPADTELLGVITVANKAVLTRNQLNEIREAQTVLAVELVWRDLQTGQILSVPVRPQLLGDTPLPGAPIPISGIGPGPSLPTITGAPVSPPSDPNAAPPVATLQPLGTNDLPPPPPALVGKPPCVVVQSFSSFVPELGQSISTSYQNNVKRLAVQIVSMMEKPW